MKANLIEIVPLAGPVRALVTVPGSKSITNRALVLAALGEGTTTLHGALWSEDTQVMVECLQRLGFSVNVKPDHAETCNRAISVQGLGGKIPAGGTQEKPLELFVGNAGTAARFLAALVCLGKGVCRLSGVTRMHERPQAALFKSLRELGYRIDSPNDRLPALIQGGGPKPGKCRVSIAESSQFASALLLSGKVGGWQVEVSGENAEESPYVSLTAKLMAAFPARGGHFRVEPDCSSGSYFWAAGEPTGGAVASAFSVRVAHWPASGWQVDERFDALYLELLNGSRKVIPWISTEGARPMEPRTISRAQDLGDSIMTAIVMAPLLRGPPSLTFSGSHSWQGPSLTGPVSSSFTDPQTNSGFPSGDRFLAKRLAFITDLGRLRVQECERVTALRTELTKCGAQVQEEGDRLIVYHSTLHGAEIETYNDHRMAMCFAILGLKVPGIRLKNPACVKKTFPNFFQKLAAPPPAGLGAVILDAATGRALRPEELFAE